MVKYLGENSLEYKKLVELSLKDNLLISVVIKNELSSFSGFKVSYDDIIGFAYYNHLGDFYEFCSENSVIIKEERKMQYPDYKLYNVLYPIGYKEKEYYNITFFDKTLTQTTKVAFKSIYEGENGFVFEKITYGLFSEDMDIIECFFIKENEILKTEKIKIQESSLKEKKPIKISNKTIIKANEIKKNENVLDFFDNLNFKIEIKNKFKNQKGEVSIIIYDMNWNEKSRIQTNKVLLSSEKLVRFNKKDKTLSDFLRMGFEIIFLDFYNIKKDIEKEILIFENKKNIELKNSMFLDIYNLLNNKSFIWELDLEKLNIESINITNEVESPIENIDISENAVLKEFIFKEINKVSELKNKYKI